MVSLVRSHRFWVACSLFALLGVAGCVQETKSGDSVKYTYELWVPLTILLGGAVGLLAGVVGFMKSMNYSWVLCLLGVGGVVWGPSMMCDYAVVDSQGFTVRTGFPFMASVQQVKFDEVSAVHHIKKVSRGRRGRRINNYYYVFDLKSGGSVEVSISGNDLRKNARLRIDEQLAARNINFTDEVGLDP